MKISHKKADRTPTEHYRLIVGQTLYIDAGRFIKFSMVIAKYDIDRLGYSGICEIILI